MRVKLFCLNGWSFFLCPIKTGLSYWLMNGYHSTDVGPDSSTFHDYLGEVPDQFDTSEITNKSNYYLSCRMIMLL